MKKELISIKQNFNIDASLIYSISRVIAVHGYLYMHVTQILSDHKFNRLSAIMDRRHLEQCKLH